MRNCSLIKQLTFAFIFLATFLNLNSQAIFPFQGYWNLEGKSTVEQVRLDSMSGYEPNISDVKIYYTDSCILDSISYCSDDCDETYTYKYEFIDKKIFLSHRYEREDYTNSYEQTFDSLGRLIYYEWSGYGEISLRGGNQQRWFDENNRLVREDYVSSFTGGTGSGETSRHIKNEYDQEGNLIWRKRYRGNYHTVHGADSSTDTLVVIYDGPLKKKEYLKEYEKNESWDTGQSVVTLDTSHYETCFIYSNDSLVEKVTYLDSLLYNKITYSYSSRDTTITHFNRKQEVIRREEIRNAGERRSYILLSKDGDTLLPEIRLLQEVDANDSIILKATYEYKNGHWELDEKLEFLYDDRGNLLESARVTENIDSILGKRIYTYEYNLDNQLMSESYTYYFPPDSTWMTRLNKEYFYDDEGRLSQIVDNVYFHNWWESAIVDTMRFSYNELGLEIRRQFYQTDWHRYYSDSPCYDGLSSEDITESSDLIKIFPNPAINEFEVIFDKDLFSKNLSVSIYDMRGRHLITKKKQAFDANLSVGIGGNLEQGSYLILVSSDNEIIESKLVFKL